MALHDWNNAYQNTQKGNGTAPQQPGESKDAANDRFAGADQARKDRNK